MRIEEMNPDPDMGVEVELERTTPPIDNEIEGVKFTVTDDGSVRLPTKMIGDYVGILPLINGEKIIYPSGTMVDRERIRNPDKGIGTELVTKPYTLSVLRPALVRWASIYGHLPSTPRASVHVHVDVGNAPWRFVQRMVHWFILLEAPLYRLSALTEEHRGLMHYGNEGFNDHRYARPLSNSIGLWNENRDRVGMINPEGLIEAQSASHFMAHWGRLDRYWETVQHDHYNPHRLHGINIASVVRQGTIEFRLWNGVYRYLPYIAEVCHALYKLALRKDPRQYERPAMKLGGVYDFNHDELSTLLELDIFPIWNRMSASSIDDGWVGGCQENYRAPHYAPWAGKVMHSLKKQPLGLYSNNAGIQDMHGDESYSLYIRKDRRLNV